jgi:hypothetical protein
VRNYYRQTSPSPDIPISSLTPALIIDDIGYVQQTREEMSSQ